MSDQAVQSKPTQQASKINIPKKGSWDKTTAAIIWLIGVYFTGTLIQTLGVGEPICWIGGALAQWAFTRFERDIWKRKGVVLASGIAMTFDVGSNAGGVWPWVDANLKNTGLWQMIRSITGLGDPNVIAKILFTLAAAILVAAGAEYLWSRGD